MIINQNKCLYCYSILENNEIDFHEKCSKKFFGKITPIQIPFGLSDIKEKAFELLGKSVSITGAQPKLLMETQGSNAKGMRFTLIELSGNYILKLPREQFPQMPENEDLTMHLASLLKIKTAEHTLIHLKSGETAYLAKRFDRTKKGKLPQEDMGQLTGTLTENKYRGSLEKIGKAIKQFSTYPGIDLISFYELILFSFITGNSDMHLKNFSLLTNQENEVRLAPAYDLLSVTLLIKEDSEEMALPINGKKWNLSKDDFISFAQELGFNEVSIQNVHRKFKVHEQSMLELIDNSFLYGLRKEEYKELLSGRMERLN
jgi:serine/threonine-protein kinase HipA